MDDSGFAGTASRARTSAPRGSAVSHLGDDFRGARSADRAIVVVNAALRQRQFAATGAGFRVESMHRGHSLLRRQLRQIHAGKLAGAIGMREKNLAGVFEGFHFHRHRHACQRADFQFVQQRIAQALVLLHHAAFRIEHERCGQSGDSAVLHAHFVRSHGNGIVDAGFLDNFLDRGGIVVVHRQPDDLQMILIFVLQFDQVGNFGAARSAPGGPEIQQNHFAVRVSERERLAVQRVELELRRRIRIADKANDISFALGAGGGGASDEEGYRQKYASALRIRRRL